MPVFLLAYLTFSGVDMKWNIDMKWVKSFLVSKFFKKILTFSLPDFQ